MKLRETNPQQVLEKLMSYVYVDGVRLSETSPIEFWRKKSYPNVGAVRPRETNRNTRDGCVWGGGGEGAF